jgi:tetratricopeptide (TPR) repeat protein
MALLEAPQSEERKKLLTEASEQCSKLYENYPQRLAGLTARLYEGRCYEELDDPKQAVEAYNNVINDLPDGDTTFRALKTQALKRAVDLWLQDKEYEKAVDKSAAWAKTARGTELFDPDWLALKLSSAKALIGLAATLPTSDGKVAGYRADAKALALDLLKSKNSEFQGPAGGLLTQIGRAADANDTVSAKKVPTTGKKALIGAPGGKQIQLTAETHESSSAPYAAAAAEIKTFDAAFEKASEAEDDIKTTQLEISFAQQEKPDAKQIADLKAAAEKKYDEAFAFCQRAIALSDDKTDLEKLNHLRYLLCYFHYSKGNYDDAVVIGETVAKKHPKATNARDAARVALASLDAVYRQRKAAGEDVAFESAELQNLIDYIIKTWPDDPVAGAASEILVNVYTTGGDYEKALAALERLPENSPARVEAQLRYGQSLWAKYLRTVQQNREAKAAAGDPSSTNTPFEDPKVQQELDALLKQAQDALERGVAGLRKLNDVSDRAMLATVSLTQLYENGSKADKAITLLEDAKIGPLTLVKRKHPSTQTQGMAAEIYKTALRSYIDAEPQQIDKATAALDALEKIYAEDPQGPAKLTQMLVSIAVDLKQQLEELARQGDRDRQARLTKAFDKFLSRIPERGATADFKILNWVGATYENLAGGLNTGGKLVPGADGYYRQAIKAYEDIISRAKADPNFAPPERMPAVKRNLAVDYRNVGEYEKAISVLAELLKEMPLLLPVQVEAARTYQARGAQDPTFYVRAIEGGDKPETANIWGWSKLSVQTSRDQRFRDIFHEARYNLAFCRKRFAEASDKPEVKKVAFQKAKYDIRNTMQFDATLGGDKWKPQYESLLKEIQTGLSEEPIGLQALDEKSTNAKDGAKN